MGSETRDVSSGVGNNFGYFTPYQSFVFKKIKNKKKFAALF